MNQIIELYKRDVDRTLLIENLRLTPQERSEKFQRAMRLVFEIRNAAIPARHNAVPRHESK